MVVIENFGKDIVDSSLGKISACRGYGCKVMHLPDPPLSRRVTGVRAQSIVFGGFQNWSFSLIDFDHDGFTTHFAAFNHDIELQKARNIGIPRITTDLLSTLSKSQSVCSFVPTWDMATMLSPNEAPSMSQYDCTTEQTPKARSIDTVLTMNEPQNGS